MSAKTWAYTINNYTKDDIEQFKKFDCKRHRCALEIGEKGTKHMQGKITFTRTYRLAALKKLNNKVHWEIAKVEDFNYETKGKELIEIDNRKQGKRSDLENIIKNIQGKKKFKEIVNENPIEYIKYNRGIEKLFDINSEKRNWLMEIYIIWGKPGIGKTKYVWDKYGIDNVYAKSPGKWWDGYQGEDVVLIDDFDPEHSHELVFDYWLKLFDRYPFRIEKKGSSCEFNSKKIYITSNFDPELWFHDRKNKNAFKRRITEVIHMTKDNGHVVTVSEVA